MKLSSRLLPSAAALPFAPQSFGKCHQLAPHAPPRHLRRQLFHLPSNRISFDFVASNNRDNFMQHIPNILTISRVFMIPIFMSCYIFRKQNLGVAVYILSCITDLLDGYLARKFNVTSSFGAFLDPVADKLMVAAALILLVCQLPVWWFACPVVLIICREIAVSALREWMAEKGKRNTVQVGYLGKVKTATQMISTALLLATCPGTANFDIAASTGLAMPAMFTAGLLLLYLSTFLTVFSAVEYFQAAFGNHK